MGVRVPATLVVALVPALGAIAAPARAELVYFASGRSLSVSDHRSEGPSLVLVLRAGGEIVCDPSVVARIEPDEVPHPEPDSPAPAATRSTNPGEPYGRIIDEVASEHGVDARLVRAVIQVESGYRQDALSRKGAMGLMQLMPDTARQYAVANPYDPRANIEAGVRHLKSLLQRFSLTQALAAYNAGEAAVQRYRGIPPYAETREYVSRIVSLFGRSRI